MSNKLPTFKLLFVGDVDVGKTSIVQRYVYNIFESRGTHTKMDIAVKHIYIEGKKTRLQLWDIAGQDIFIGLAPTYYSSASGAFIVIDITNKSSLHTAKLWKLDIDSKVLAINGSMIPCILLANKWDIIQDNTTKKRQISDKELDECCLQNGFQGWFSTSAKTPNNIKKCVDFLIARILKNRKNLEKQNNIKSINPCCCCCIPTIIKVDDERLLQNESRFRYKLSFSSNRQQQQYIFDDDYNNDINDKQSINANTVNTFGIKDFEDETKRIFDIYQCLKMFPFIIMFPIITVPQLFDFIIYAGYYTKKCLPSTFDATEVRQRIKYDFLGTIIGSNANLYYLSNTQFNNIEQALSSRLFVKQTRFQLFQRFILCLIINYCLIIQFILFYHYIINDNHYQYLTSFECVGPFICWLIIIFVMNIWFGYKCILPDNIINDEMLCYQNLYFQYENNTETASVLNFFLSLNQFNINKVYNKDKYRNIIINIVLILFALEYAAIPSILRFICNDDNDDNDSNVIPSSSMYFLWINSIILNFFYAFIFLKICCNTTVDAFRLLLVWYSSMLNMINYNKSIQNDCPFISFENYDNIISWVELRGYLHYTSFATSNNIEIWTLLYMISMTFLIIISVIYCKNLNFKHNTDINHNSLCIGAIYYCLLCILHSLFIYWLGSTFHSLHLKQLKECNRQRLILNRQILKNRKQFDILKNNEKKQEKQENDENIELDINESIDAKYDPFGDNENEETINIQQLSINISSMERSHQHLNDVIQFLKQHDFTPNFFGIIPLNKLIWISILIIILTATISVLYIFKSDL